MSISVAILLTIIIIKAPFDRHGEGHDPSLSNALNPIITVSNTIREQGQQPKTLYIA